MNQDVSATFETIFERFRNETMSVLEFQRRIDAALNMVATTDEREHERLSTAFVNELELILYTLPEQNQREAALETLEKIVSYLKRL